MSNVIDFAKVSARRRALTEIDDRWGLCPACVKAGEYRTQQLWRNLGKDHYVCCDIHNCCWLVGTNIFSSWQHEPEEVRRKNAAKLGAMRRVTPFFKVAEASKGRHE